jgi:hypothetical protein
VNINNVARWIIVVPPEGAARTTGLEIASTFIRICKKDTVKIFDCLSYTKFFSEKLKENSQELICDIINQSLIVQCLDFSASHVLVLALSPVTLFALNTLKKQHILTLHWFYEDFRKAIYWKDVVSGYDYFFAIQKGIIADKCMENGIKFKFLQTAAGLGLNTIHKEISKFDVAFIGIPSVYRISVLEYLYSKGIRIAIAGFGWDRYSGIMTPCIINKGWTSQDETMSILSDSRIGINISVTTPETDRENTHISPRVFDIMKAGCQLVTEEAPLIHEVLPDCVFHTFMNETEAYEKIKKIVDSPDAGFEIINKNIEIVEHRHTYEQRIKELIFFSGAD